MPKPKHPVKPAASGNVEKVLETGEDLNLRQRRFCEEYLIDANGKQAAIRAGYTAVSAESTASTLLSYPKVAAHIAALEQGRSERVGFTADEVLRELSWLVRSNVADYEFDETGLKLAADVPASAWRAVSSVKRKVRTIPQEDGDPIVEVDTEFRLWDKNAALEKAMKHLGLTKDGPTINLGVAVVVRRED